VGIKRFENRFHKMRVSPLFIAAQLYLFTSTVAYIVSSISIPKPWAQFESNIRQYGRKFAISVMTTDASMITDIQDAIQNGPVPSQDRKYLINGWRWHTLSVIRDLARFRVIVANAKLTSDIDTRRDRIQQIVKCQEFVCGFNWQGLMKIERDIFFPWLEVLLPDRATPLIRDIRAEHKEIENLCIRMAEESQRMVIENNAQDADRSQQYSSRLQTMDDLISQMTNSVRKIQGAQETIFVPYVASYVTSKEQEVFNRKVIRKLGLIDSQVHLVSMADALKEDRPQELPTFQAQIPRVAQLMIPVWRKRLYAPKAACLDPINTSAI